jgi:hypothetical protein
LLIITAWCILMLCIENTTDIYCEQRFTLPFFTGVNEPAAAYQAYIHQPYLFKVNSNKWINKVKLDLVGLQAGMYMLLKKQTVIGFSMELGMWNTTYGCAFTCAVVIIVLSRIMLIILCFPNIFFLLIDIFRFLLESCQHVQISPDIVL